jgi:hypothetical protein
MILINYKIQDGERVYSDWNYMRNFNKSDYDNGKIKDFDILEEMFNVKKEDLENEHCQQYWDDTALVWVESVQDIDEHSLNILRRYV